MGPYEQTFDPVATITGVEGASREFDALTPEQQTAAEQMIREAEVADIYNALAGAAEAINRVSGVLGGIDSEDLTIEYNPETGRSLWSLSEKIKQEISEDASLGAADKERMVYQRLDDDEDGNAQYGFDYVRSVASTEP